jgi:multiple sugar transport system ATP-binding protein
MVDLELRGIEKRFGAFHALKSVSLSVAAGEFVVLVGPSGCGKSTLLRTIAGLESIDAGEIRIGGREVTELEPGDRGVAMVFQSYALYPHMTVAQNMGFALEVAGRPRVEIEEAVAKAAATLRITEHLQKRPKQLSGGQRQRVAIGRAITRNPGVFLFDEPLSNLDAALRTQMRVELGRLHAELGATMVYVTHDQVEAMTMADRIVVLREGRIEQVGSPLDLYNRPATRFVAGFLGSPPINFIEATLQREPDGRALIAWPGQEGLVLATAVLPETAASGGRVIAGVRPASISLAAPGEGVTRAQVRLVEQLGHETILHLQPEAPCRIQSELGLLVAQVPHQTLAKLGDVVGLRFDPHTILVFADEANG